MELLIIFIIIALIYIGSMLQNIVIELRYNNTLKEQDKKSSIKITKI